VDGLEVNLEHVREGSAWVYSRYLRELPVTDRVLYVAAQRLAQAQRRGLWRDEPLGKAQGTSRRAQKLNAHSFTMP
jgi:endonuclease YncB( thermonuclease family)